MLQIIAGNYSRHLTVKCQMLERGRKYLILKYQMVGLRKDCERKKGTCLWSVKCEPAKKVDWGERSFVKDT